MCIYSFLMGTSCCGIPNRIYILVVILFHIIILEGCCLPLACDILSRQRRTILLNLFQLLLLLFLFFLSMNEVFLIISEQ